MSACCVDEYEFVQCWIRQPLLVADLVEVEHYPWDYQPSMSQ